MNEPFHTDWGRAELSKRTKAALDQRKAEGVRLGAPSKVPASIKDMIEQLYNMGMSLNRIAITLTENGIPTVKGGKKWYASTVQGVLTTIQYDREAQDKRRDTQDATEVEALPVAEHPVPGTDCLVRVIRTDSTAPMWVITWDNPVAPEDGQFRRKDAPELRCEVEWDSEEQALLIADRVWRHQLGRDIRSPFLPH